MNKIKKNNCKQRFAIVRKLKLGNRGGRTNPLEQSGLRATDRTQSIQPRAPEGADFEIIATAANDETCDLETGVTCKK